MKAHRPTIMGTRHMIAATQYLAAEAGFKILEAGGNAIDAGVAAGIALGVVQPEFVNVAGVAPIIIYSAAENRLVTIPGLGPWPKALDPQLFQRRPLARERHRLESDALRDLLRSTYRGARASVASRIESLDALEVTLATDVVVMKRITSRQAERE